MNDQDIGAFVGAYLLVMLCGFAVLTAVTVVFLLTLQKALKRCDPSSRTMVPGQVWLWMIPIFNLIWAFFVVNALSDSLHNEFTRRGMVEEPQPGRSLGLAFAILCVVSIVPILGFLTGLAAFVCWILYWIKIAGYSAKVARPFVAPA